MPELKLNDAVTILAARSKKAIEKAKVDTVKEVKTNLKAMVEELLGSGTATYKALSDVIIADVMQRVPQQALFSPDRAKSYDPEGGFGSMSKSQIDVMAKELLFMVVPQKAHRHVRALNGFDDQAFQRSIRERETGLRAMGVDTGESGGFLVPEEFKAEVMRKLVHISVMANMCQNWPGVGLRGSMNRETGTVSVYIANQLVSGTKTQGKLGQIQWDLQKRLMVTQLAKELFNFSGIDVLTYLSTLFAEQAQKTTDYFYLLGTGSLQPTGLLIQTTGMKGLTMAGANLQWQDTITLKHGIKSQYRNEKGNCAYMTNDNTIQMISKLTDDQNRPVFLDRGSEGIGGPNIPPQTLGFLNGQPVLENPYTPGPVAETINDDTLASRATTATIVFSNFKRGYAAFTGPTAKIETSDQTSDAFLTESMYTKFVDWFDGKPAIPEATALLTGVK